MLVVHRSNRMERLADALCEVLAADPPPPLEMERVVVPSLGLERWLSAWIASRLGIAAAIEFPFPSSALLEAVVGLLGEPGEGAHRWTTERLRWEVHRVLGEGVQAGPVQRYLQRDPEGLRRFQLAGRVAECFDRYITWRPDEVRLWESSSEGDWQGEIWRRVRARVSADHLAGLEAQVDLALADPSATSRLPRRLLVFGASSLAPLQLRLLANIGRRIPVHLFALAPCAEYLGDLQRREANALSPHPLLASLGQLGRSFQEQITSLSDFDDAELFEDPPEETVLGRLQADLLHLRRRGPHRELPAAPVDPADDSLLLHSCHGPTRQLEVLQDRLLDLFARKPDLQPRDVVVLLPDVAEWAPLVESVFSVPPEDPRHIPWRLADRPARHGNAAADALLALLELVDARCTASELLDLLVRPIVARRFGMDAEDLERVTTWVRDARITWGRDQAHRAAHGQPPQRLHTWRGGLDRLLMGHAMAGRDRHLFGGVLPVDAVEGHAAELAGRLAEFAESLFGVLDDLARPRPMAEWRTALEAAITAMMARDDAAAEDHRQLGRALDGAFLPALEAAHDEPMALAPVRSLMDRVLGRKPGGGGIAGGQLTFCAMVPLRGIPFRVVALVGMDERAFPRKESRPGFDLTLRHPRPGDRSTREDDRWLFLETLLAAREHLWISWSGRDPRDNTPRPPSVLVGELIDHLVEAADPPGEGDARERVLRRFVVQHPLQAFSPAAFQAPLFSYSREHQAAAHARLADKRLPMPTLVDGVLPPAPPAPVQLDDLAAWLEHPARWYLQRVLGVLPEDRDDETPADREPLELDALQEWELAETLLRLGLELGKVPASHRAIRASGRLPPGPAGDLAFQAARNQVGETIRKALPLVQGAPRPGVQLNLDLGGDRRLVGRVEGLRPGGNVTVLASRARPKRLLRLWVRHLALAAANHPQPSVVVAPADHEAVVWSLGPVDAPTPLLADLVDLYRLGQQRPLPFFPRASFRYAFVVQRQGKHPLEALGKARSEWAYERDDAANLRLFGAASLPAFQLEGVPPEPGFEELALRIYRPLLQHWRDQ